MNNPLLKRAVAELIGTAMLLAAVVGSGIMGERLAAGNTAWFTASTSFANPAVTLARSVSDTFVGIRPVDAPAFIVAQLAGAFAATALFSWLVPSVRTDADSVIVPHERG